MCKAETATAAAPVVPPAPSSRVYAKNSDDFAIRWKSPFAKWTAEDWKTRKFPTRSELKAVIPEHCFERSASTGFAYIVRDTIILAVTQQLFSYAGLSAQLPTTVWGYPVWLLGWFTYAIVQGGFCGGLWVIGHECGHGAFSPHAWLNDLVGWVLHSAFLVPYFSWQFSHAKHHRRTNDLIEGETHIPELFDDKWCEIRYKAFQVLGYHGFAVADVLAHLLIFFPLYFVGLISLGRKDANGDPVEPGTWMDHYRPTSRLFPSKMRVKVALSDLGIAIALFVAYQYTHVYGFFSVFMWYGLPTISMNHVFLVAITWMQHTHPSIPHFGESDWTWIKGAIVGTVDRPDQVIDFFAHNIGSTHVCHHLFHEVRDSNSILIGLITAQHSNTF